MAEMQARFADTLEVWSRATPAPLPEPGATGEFSPGLPGDPDPEGSAAALDAWAVRHAEPWMRCPPAPVTRALGRA